MKAQVFWTKEKYPGRIALVPRPRGGDWLEDETAAWADAGLDVNVSMLDVDETQSFDLLPEGEFCKVNEIEFISFPVTDRSVPKLNQALYKLTKKLKTSLSEGKNIGIHCRQSIGRAPLLAAILMTSYGIEPSEAFRQLSVVRGIEVPETVEQKEWVEKFAEESAIVSA
jgi:protein-tyrosine phosphatase